MSNLQTDIHCPHCMQITKGFLQTNTKNSKKLGQDSDQLILDTLVLDIGLIILPLKKNRKGIVIDGKKQSKISFSPFSETVDEWFVIGFPLMIFRLI